MIELLPGLENPETTYRLPVVIREAIVEYTQHHRERGGFVMAVLRHDLMEAVARADPESTECLREIVSFVQNEIPGNIHGSAEVVRGWLAKEHHTYVCRAAGCDGVSP